MEENISWRENISQQAQDEMDKLFSAGIDIAFDLLSKNKEFYPFGLQIPKNGDVDIVAVHQGEERPLSQDVISDLKAVLSSSRNDFKAAAIVYDVKVNRKDDAIVVLMEHCEGEAIEVIAPYEISGIFKKVKLRLERSEAYFAEKYIWADEQ